MRLPGVISNRSGALILEVGLNTISVALGSRYI